MIVQNQWKKEECQCPPRCIPLLKEYIVRLSLPLLLCSRHVMMRLESYFQAKTFMRDVEDGLIFQFEKVNCSIFPGTKYCPR